MQEEERGDVIEVPGLLGLRITDVSYTYPGNEGPTINHLSCDFRPGVSTAIVGETGSGKSTLIRLMMSLLQPDSGHVTLYNDKQEYEMNPSLRCNFRFVPQGNSLMSGTVRDNLLLGNADATEDEMREALRLAAADFVFERPEGLDTPCSEQGSGLSEGQAQRIAIARALLQKGAIILMDEACSSVDSLTERRILENLSKGIQDKTIIWVTHHAAVQEYMTRTITLQTQPKKKINS
jgi:ABC-type multidrug transport system fused ATPase/permease subunit